MSTSPQRQNYFPHIDKNIPTNIAQHLINLYTMGNQHDQAIINVNGKISSSGTSNASSRPSSSPTSAPTAQQPVTVAQAQQIASQVITQQFTTQLQANLGPVNNQTGTSYTMQSSDYGGLVTINNAAASTVTLNPVVNPRFFTGFANIGTGTSTLTPGAGVNPAGTINGQPNLPLAAGESALVYYDGTNWWAIITAGPSAGSGVTSLNGETGALSLTSMGGTVTITTPTSTTINLEAAGGGGGYLKGTVTINLSATSGTFIGTATIAGAMVNMAAIMTPPQLGSGSFNGGNLTASVDSANSVTCVISISGFASPPGNVTFPVVVFP